MLRTLLFGLLYFVQDNTLVDYYELIDITNDEIEGKLTLRVWKLFYDLKAIIAR